MQHSHSDKTANLQFKPAYKKHMVIAANPGYQVVDWVFDPEDRLPKRPKLEPVQAWLVSIYEHRDQQTTITVCDPVIHEPKSSIYEGAVLYPDGRVVIPGKRSFKSLSEFVADRLVDWHNNYSAFAKKREELNSKGQLKAEQERADVECSRS